MIFYVRQDDRDLWYWRLEMADGTVVAVSGNLYRAKSTCYQMIEIVKSSEEAQILEARKT